MSDYKELVKRLRDRAAQHRMDLELRSAELAEQAAAAIERLHAEVSS